MGFELSSWPSLEAQVAAIADDIAYDNHDIDDGLRSGLLEIRELIEQPIVARFWSAIGDRHPGIPAEKRQRALVRDMIGAMVRDVLAETDRRVSEAGVETIDDVREAGRALVGFSEALAGEERRLKRFLYTRLYDWPSSSQCARRLNAWWRTWRRPIVPIPRCFPSRGAARGMRRSAANHRRFHRRNDRPLRHCPS